MKKNNTTRELNKYAMHVVRDMIVGAFCLIAFIALVILACKAGINGEDVGGILFVACVLGGYGFWLISTAMERARKEYSLDHYGFYVDRNGNKYTKK